MCVKTDVGITWMAISSEPTPSAVGDALTLGDAASLDLRARLRLLQSLAARGSTEIAALVIPPVILLLYKESSSASATPLIIWCVVMMGLTLALMRIRRQLRREWAGMTEDVAAKMDPRQLDRWEHRLGIAAFIGGVVWSLVILCSHAGAGYEFRLFIYMVLCGVLASATTFLAPLPAVFWRFFVGMYGPMLLAANWYFANYGLYMVALLLLYGFTIARHALAARKFTQLQLQQERERHALAEQYHHAKVQAESALAEKSWFLSAASHDLRQPLQALGFMLESARLRNNDSGVAKALADVQTCTRDLDMMFNDLLDLSRLEDGALELRLQPVRLRTVLADAQRMFGPVAEQRGLRLRVVMPRRRDAVITTDLPLLRQMVFNLVHNALRYTQGGSVMLACRRRNGAWCVQVWDTGVGIAESDVPKVFATHYRAGSGRAGEGPQTGLARGRGLGLAVVARSADRMNVRYGVQSRLGRGSCFWLQWPASADASASVTSLAEIAPPSDLPLPQPLKGCVLLLDADDVQVHETARLLEGWGLQVQSAPSAAAAIAQMDADALPDFIVCGELLSDDADAIGALESVLAQCPDATGALLASDGALIRRAGDDGYLVFALPLQPRALHAVLQRVAGISTYG